MFGVYIYIYISGMEKLGIKLAMNSEYKRLQSFHGSRVALKKLGFTGSPAEFAENGLYYCCEESSIRCAFCTFEFSLGNNNNNSVRELFLKPGRVHIKNRPLCGHMTMVAADEPLHLHVLHGLVQDDPRLEVVRLRSFRWMPTVKLDHNRDRESVARVGLYYSPRDRAVLCAFCDFRVSEFCRKPELLLKLCGRGRFAAFLIDGHSSCPFVQKPADESRRSWIIRKFENVAIDETDDLCVPKHPEMETVGKRYGTFCYNEWPHKKPPSSDLAQCGFYFRGMLDLVTCYWCDITLGSWQPEDVPRFEHFQKSPRCRVALLMVDSEETVALARKGLEDPEKYKYAAPEKKIIKEEEEQNTLKCILCCENFRNTLFINCKHFVCCENCSLQINDDACPVCRQPVTEKIKVFL